MSPCAACDPSASLAERPHAPGASPTRRRWNRSFELANIVRGHLRRSKEILQHRDGLVRSRPGGRGSAPTPAAGRCARARSASSVSMISLARSRFPGAQGAKADVVLQAEKDVSRTDRLVMGRDHLGVAVHPLLQPSPKVAGAEHEPLRRDPGSAAVRALRGECRSARERRARRHGRRSRRPRACKECPAPPATRGGDR